MRSRTPSEEKTRPGLSFASTGEKITYENVVNLKDEEHVFIYGRLASQKYWHVLIADDRREVIDFFEFLNKYGLSDPLKQAQQVCSRIHISDFSAAKAEYEATYSIEELLKG